ncbi:MAG: lactate utilization protein [bacterium]
MPDSGRTLQKTLREALESVDATLTITDRKGIAKTVVSLLDSLKAQAVAITSEEELVDFGVVEAVTSRGATAVIAPPTMLMDETSVAEWKQRLAEADVGITSALAIAAETGTLLLPPLSTDQRAVSLLPAHHVVLLSADCVVPDIAALFHLWQKSGRTNGNAVFVTGPSRTADIEKELVLGVHGPQSLHVLLIR